ncbi:MAG: PQQ-binding-like beta-propeller repeat protein, partial [Planctomycetota bacterium]
MKPLVATVFPLLLACAAAALAAGAHPPEALYVNVYDEAEEALAALGKLTGEGRWDRAAETAQEYLAKDPGLFQIEPGRYVSFAARVRREVLAWPEKGIRAYRARYDDSARRKYEAALARRSVDDLTRVVRTYLPSSSGPKALAARAELRAQRGELREALRDVRRLLRMEQRAGLPVDELKSKQAALREALRRSAARPALSAGRIDGVGRDARRSGLYPGTYTIGAREWSVPVRDAEVDQHVARGLRARRRAVPRLSYPAVADNRAFVQTSEWIAALDLETGEATWRWPAAPDRPDRRDLRDALRAPFLAADRVFALIGGGLVALSPTTGAELWARDRIVKQEPVRAPGAEERPRPPAVFANSLVAGAGKVFVVAVAARRETEAFVAAFDARNGARLWQRRLCSQVFRGVLGRGPHPAPPAFDQGVVYVSTNLGAAAAVDAATGEVRWLTEYPAFSPARRRAALTADDCWENNPPVVSGGRLLLAPQDSDHLIALDLDDGRVRWQAPRLGMRYLAGVSGGRAFLAGDRAAAVDLDTGKLAWLAGLDAPAVARPAPTKDALLVPTRDALVALAARTGQVAWRYRLDEPGERGNLALAGGRLLSLAHHRIDAWGPASDIDGGSARANLRRGERLDRLGDLEAAIKQYRLALLALDAKEDQRELRRRVLRATSDAYARLGDRAAAEGRYDRAADAFLRARREAPTVELAARAGLRLAEVRRAQGNRAAAVAAYQDVIRGRRGAAVALGGVDLPAEAVAEARIGRILDQHGRGAYEPFERAAAALWAKAANAEAGDRPTLLLRLAAEYPNSSAAAKARRELGRAPGVGLEPEPIRVWRTAFDSSRRSPVLLRGADYRVAGEPVLLMAVRNSGRFPSFVWNAVECRRVADGRVLWRTWVGECAASAHVLGGTVLTHGDQVMTALDGATGRTLWTVGPPRGQGEPGGLPFRLPDLDRIRDTAAGGGMAFAAKASGRLLAVDVKTGKEAWSSKIDGHVLAGSAWFDGDAFVVCTENPGAVHRFVPKTGERLAKLTFERADNRLTDVPAWQPAARRLCVVVGDREVRNIDVRRGKTLWSVESDGAVGRITASPDGTRVVVLPDRWTFAGKVQCIGAKTGKVTW